MKILYTHRTQGQGAEGAHVAGMVEAFRSLGHEVTVDCLPGSDPTLRSAADVQPEGLVSAPRWPRRLILALSRHSPQWLFGMLELLYNVPLALRFLPKLWRHKPELVYERYSLCTFVPSLACRLWGVPHVLEVNDSVVIERSRPLKLARTSRFIERRVLGWTRLSVTISQQFKTQLAQGLGVDTGKLLVCPNAVSRRRFIERPRLSPEALDALRAGLGVAGRPVIGSAGQFVAWHGLPEFLSAAADYLRQSNVFVLFIGDGPTREATMAVAREQGLESQIRFTGMLAHEAVPDHLQLLDVAIIPRSNIHGSPMKLIEFMAMRLPVVAPALPPILEVLRDGETGFLFPYDDMPAMVRALERCFADPERMHRVGNSARDYVVKHLTWDAHALQVLHRLSMADV